MSFSFDFHDKNVLVFGGTSGINLGIAQAFAGAGARLGVASRSQDKVDAAVAAANGTEFGLGASVWSDDLDAAADVAARLDAGSVWVNRHGLLSPEIPFGGMKQSGVGRANGAVGIDHYCELKTVSVGLPRKRS